MSEDISIEVIQSTQALLGQFIKKPPLTEKLLRKPPFRYLHDLITAVTKNTGFFAGLFTDKELNSENVKERNEKIQYLQKVIKVVNIVLDTELTVKPSRIIAGHEPEKTNELLQKIGEALVKNLKSDDAVRIVLNESNGSDVKKSEKPPQPKKKNVDKPEQKSKAKDVDTKSKDKKIQPTSKQNGKSKKDIEKPSGRKVEKSPESAERSKMKNNKINENGNSKIIENKVTNEMETKVIPQKDENFQEESAKPPPPPQLEEIPVSKGKNDIKIETNNVVKEITDNQVKNETKDVNEIKKLNKSPEKEIVKQSSVPSSKNNSAKIAKREIEKQDSRENVRMKVEKQDSRENVKQIRRESIQADKKMLLPNKELAEPAIAKPGSEEVKRPKTSLRPPSVRPSSARPGAPRVKEANIDMIITTNVAKEKVRIIVEDYDKKPEADDNNVFIETLPVASTEGDNFAKMIDNSETSNKGHLVEQIIATQKELTGNSQKIDIEWERGTRQEREASNKEVEILKSSLQSLSRVANPLGKLVEHVQEDAEIMRQELLQWREVRKKAAESLHQQEALTEKAIQPLETKLKKLNDSILEQLEMINTVKSNINQNNAKIKLLVDGR